eukprot:15840278-Heterocapsa_arctica.AAC.1
MAFQITTLLVTLGRCTICNIWFRSIGITGMRNSSGRLLFNTRHHTSLPGTVNHVLPFPECNILCLLCACPRPSDGRGGPLAQGTSYLGMLAKCRNHLWQLSM